MKLGEVLVNIDNYNFTNFGCIQMKNKSFLMTYLMDGPSIHALNKFRFYEILEGIHDEEVLIMFFK